MRILIADDDVTCRAALGGVLKRFGHDVEDVSDGMEALERLRRPDAPRIAILDVMMPRMDGLEVVRQVRALDQMEPPYLIMLSAQDTSADIIAGLDAGASDYLSKPFRIGELRARVDVGRRMVETQAALASRVAELRAAAEQIRTLRGIVPICASCKKVRTDAGYWQQVEVYVRSRTEAEFSHCICPACAGKLYPELASNVCPSTEAVP